MMNQEQIILNLDNEKKMHNEEEDKEKCQDRGKQDVNQDKKWKEEAVKLFGFQELMSSFKHYRKKLKDEAV